MLRFMIRMSFLALLNFLVLAIPLPWIFIDAIKNQESKRFPDLPAWLTYSVSLVIVTQLLLGVLGLLNLFFELLVLVTLSLILWRSINIVDFKEWMGKVVSTTKNALHHLTSVNLSNIVLLGCFVLALVVGALAEPSTMFDTLAYHMPMVVDWYQQRAIVPFYLPNADYANSYFPGNGELLLLWSFLPLESDIFLSVTTLLMWLGLGGAIFYVSRQIGLSYEIAGPVSLMLILSPVVLSEALDPAWDVCSAAFFFLALGHLIRFGRSLSFRDLLLFALAVGLHMGTKYSGPLYAVMLGFGFMCVLVMRNRVITLPQALQLVGLAVAGVLLTGGFWYLRNLLSVGNPVYPVDITVAGFRVFQGVAAPLWEATRLGRYLLRPGLLGLWLRALLRAYGVLVLATMGIGFIALVAGAIGRLAWHKQDIAWRRNLGLLLFVALASTPAYLNTPYSIMRFHPDTPISTEILAAGMRFSLIAVISWFLLIVALMERAVFFRRLLITVIVPLSIVQSIIVAYDHNASRLIWRLFTFDHLRVVMVIMIVGFVVVPLGYRFSRRLTSGKVSSAVPLVMAVGLLVMSIAMWGVELHRIRYRFPVYRREYGLIAEGWEWLADNVQASRIAYTGLPLSYALYGRDYSNEVRYVNIAGELNWRHHNFTIRETSYRAKMADYTTWIDNLTLWSASHLVCSGENQTDECGWAAEHPEHFALLYATPAFVVYAIQF